ncbi:hypothetical protein ACEWY4_018243 [Coilia grayii]|uniref:Putative nuclease HARBI1 n=1 Tax=Coilia grayii TaxID=363190 RepID=A0ABD1JJ48_9TELE
MAAIQRILFLLQERRRERRRRSNTTYINAFVRTSFNPLEVLPDEAIIRKFRLSRGQIMELLGVVHPHLVRRTRRSFALTPAVQLLAALRFYATGSYYEVLGDGLGLSRASLSRAVTAVTDVLLLHLAERMSFPSTPEDIRRVNQGFHAIAGLPRVIGAIDGTLVPIATPSTHGPRYICCKGYAAINAMVVCSAEGEFLDVVARWPGSTHDAFIWENPGLCRAAEGGGFGGCWLLGDSSFPLRPFLLTPYLHAQTEPQAGYNRAHKLTRAVVERAIGVWKQRFRCLNKGAGGLQLHPRKCCAVIVVTALLHNMALRANVQLPDDEGLQDEEAEDNLPDIQDLHPAGQQVRQGLVDNLFGP